MHRITGLLVAIASGITLAACTTVGPSDPGPSAAPETAPETAPSTATETATDAESTDHRNAGDRSEPGSAPDHGAYGSDPFLDDLYDRCDDGDLVACDELFWEAPLNSEYEDFALERGAGGDEADALAYVWSTMNAEERDALCWETHKLGLDASYDAFAQGYGDGAPAQVDFEQFVGTHCPPQE